MYIDNYKVDIKKPSGKIFLKGQFLLLFTSRTAVDVIRIRGLVRFVTAQTMVNGLQGRLNIGKHLIKITGMYGANGPITVAHEVYKLGEPLPAVLFDMLQIYKANPQDVNFPEAMQAWGRALYAWQSGEPRDRCYMCNAKCSTGGPCLACAANLRKKPLILRPQGIQSAEAFGKA